MPNHPLKQRRPRATLPLQSLPPIDEVAHRQRVKEALAGLPVRLRSLRLHLSLSQQEMGACVGVSARTVQRRERTPPKPKQRGVTLLLALVCHEFDVSADWLIFGTKYGMPTNDQKPLRVDGAPLFPVH